MSQAPALHDFLTLRIGGDPNHLERLLLMAAPLDGTVRVREWTSDSWNTEGADVIYPVTTLLAQVEEAYAARLALSEEIYRVRQWLSGLG